MTSNNDQKSRLKQNLIFIVEKNNLSVSQKCWADAERRMDLAGSSSFPANYRVTNRSVAPTKVNNPISFYNLMRPYFRIDSIN